MPYKAAVDVPDAAGWVGAVNLRHRGSVSCYDFCIASQTGFGWIGARSFAGLFTAGLGRSLICAASQASLGI